MPKIRIHEINGVALLLFTVCVLAGVAITQATKQNAYAIAGIMVGLYFLFAIKIVRQWEKVAVLRLGRYVGLRGPGLCHISRSSRLSVLTSISASALPASPPNPR